MDYEERSRILRRIISGKVFANIEYKGINIPIVFKDPSIDLLTEADWIYTSTYNESKINDVFTLEESFQKLMDDEEWTEEEELRKLDLEKNLEFLSDELKRSNFQKEKQKTLKGALKKTKQEIQKLHNKKNKLFSMTCEYIADLHQKRFLIRNICQIKNELLDQPPFIMGAIASYYKNYYIDEKIIRELARSDPWRLYWNLAKDTGTPLFKVATEITQSQYLLVFWTRVYDYAYQSENHPGLEVINDDDMFDTWYDGECKKANGQQVKNISSGGRTESFIPADAEGAKEVYDLNNNIMRSKIKSREKMIDKHGVVKDINLPDVKKDIQMELNKIGMEKIRN